MQICICTSVFLSFCSFYECYFHGFCISTSIQPWHQWMSRTLPTLEWWCSYTGRAVLCCWCCKVEIYISSPQTEVRYWQTRGRNITSNWKLLIGGRLYNFLFKLSFNFFPFVNNNKRSLKVWNVVGIFKSNLQHKIQAGPAKKSDKIKK